MISFIKLRSALKLIGSQDFVKNGFDYNKNWKKKLHLQNVLILLFIINNIICILTLHLLLWSPCLWISYGANNVSGRTGKNNCVSRFIFSWSAIHHIILFMYYIINRNKKKMFTLRRLYDIWLIIERIISNLF